MSVRISAARACDRCRRSKRKCLPASPHAGVNADSSGNACAVCAATGDACTFVLENRPRGPSKAYVQRLESHVKALEETVRSLGQSTARSTPQAARTATAVSPPAVPALVDSERCDSRAAPLAFSSSSTPLPPPHDPGESDRIKLAMSRLDVTDFPFRYHGSSSLHHVYLAIDGVRGFKDAEFLTRVKSSMRREFWIPPPWDVTSSAPIDIRLFATWPHPALERQLVDAYFARIDLHLPLLDPDVFRGKLSAGLAIRDRRFSAVCWLVFANAARFIDEPTTKYCGDSRSSGWAYFLAAKHAMTDADPNRPVWLPEIPDDVSLQVTVLTCTWLHGTFSPHLTWLLAGSALRASQELGLHIRDHSATAFSSSSSVSAADEHVVAAKRAFWCLYHLDINHCASSGRRPIFSEGDFDFDLPLDFYANRATSAFAQKLLLDRIIGRALDKLYSLRPGSVNDIEALLAALDHWRFALPSFLQVPLDQADSLRSARDLAIDIDNASLAVHFHFVRLLIRRPLLPRQRKPQPCQEEALRHCLADCYAITDILDRLAQRQNIHAPITSELLYPVWTAFSILQLGLEISDDSTSQPQSDPGLTLAALGSKPARDHERKKIVERMDVCVCALSGMERGWRYAGKLTDWVSESMRSLCDRFGDAFDPHLRVDWRNSGSSTIVPITSDDGVPPPSHPLFGDQDFADPATGYAIDYNLIFAEMFGVMPWIQT